MARLRIPTILFAGLSVALLAVSAIAQEKEISFDPDREAIFVMGVSPAYRTFVFSGKLDNGRFKSFMFTPARFNQLPTEGYMVGRAKADEILAITQVDVILDGRLKQFYPCGETPTPTFQVKAGQVVYVGDVKFRASEAGVAPVYGENEEAARRFMAKYHPTLAPAMVKGKIEPRPTTDKCKR